MNTVLLYCMSVGNAEEQLVKLILLSASHTFNFLAPLLRYIIRLQRVRQFPLYGLVDGASDFHVVVGHGASLLSQGDYYPRALRSMHRKRNPCRMCTGSVPTLTEGLRRAEHTKFDGDNLVDRNMVMTRVYYIGKLLLGQRTRYHARTGGLLQTMHEQVLCD
jgi:hypothetical protein